MGLGTVRYGVWTGSGLWGHDDKHSRSVESTVWVTINVSNIINSFTDLYVCTISLAFSSSCLVASTFNGFVIEKKCFARPQYVLWSHRGSSIFTLRRGTDALVSIFCYGMASLCSIPQRLENQCIPTRLMFTHQNMWTLSFIQFSSDHNHSSLYAFISVLQSVSFFFLPHYSKIIRLPITEFLVCSGSKHVESGL